uniref:SH3 domain-containing protein n=1 Tax=Romanomermis culicivorax TaxID=13658 RepID=A0A915JHA5_ROMCU
MRDKLGLNGGMKKGLPAAVAGTAANNGSAPQSFTSINVPPNAITPAGAFVTTVATTSAPSYAFVPTESLRSSTAATVQLPQPAGAQPQASSYYVFHPHLSQQHALGDLALPANAILVDKQQTTPASLAEIENNYLLRHQQRQMNAAMAAGTNLNRAAMAAGLVPFGSDVQSPLGGWQHQRQQRYPVYQMPNKSLNYSRDRRSLPIGYSDEEYELSQQMPPPSTRPLMARYKKKLMQIDNRALSEPDLRLDPRTLPQALRGKRIRPRYVVALYDYNPRHMSPNPNGARDELPFHKGQVILAFTEKDADGFYYGELNGRYGLIPSNLVVETDREGQSVLVVQQRLADLSFDDQDFDYYASQPLPERYGPYDQRDFDQRSSQQYSVNLPRDNRLMRHRPMAVTDLERWSNYSDPLLTRNRYPDYEFDPTTSQPQIARIVTDQHQKYET